MSVPGSSRLDLYNGLNDALGSDLADLLMQYLPYTEASELATKSDIAAVRSDIDATRSDLHSEIEATRTDLRSEIEATRNDLRSEIQDLREEARGEIRHLAQRIDRLHQAMIGGFAAMVAALIASGLLN